MHLIHIAHESSTRKGFGLINNAMASSWSAKDFEKYIQFFRARMQKDWMLPLRHFSEFHKDNVVNAKIGSGIHETMEEFTKELTRLRADAEQIPVMCQQLLSELQKVVKELVLKNRDHREKSESIANSLIEHICKLYETCLEAKSHENPDSRRDLEEEKSDALKILRWGWLGKFAFKDAMEKNLEGNLEQIRIRFEGMQNASDNEPKTTFTSTLPDFEIGESIPSWVKDEMLLKVRQFRHFLESKLPMRHFTQFYLDAEVSEVTATGKSQILDEFTSKLSGHGHGLEAKVSFLFNQLLTEIERSGDEFGLRNRDHREKSEALMNPVIDMICELYEHSVEAERSVKKVDPETFLKTLESGKADALLRLKYCWKPGSSRYREEQMVMLNGKLEEIKCRLLQRMRPQSQSDAESSSNRPTSAQGFSATATATSAFPDRGTNSPAAKFSGNRSGDDPLLIDLENDNDDNDNDDGSPNAEDEQINITDDEDDDDKGDGAYWSDDDSDSDSCFSGPIAPVSNADAGNAENVEVEEENEGLPPEEAEALLVQQNQNQIPQEMDDESKENDVARKRRNDANDIQIILIKRRKHEKINENNLPPHIIVVERRGDKPLFRCMLCKNPKPFKTKDHVRYHRYCHKKQKDYPFGCDACQVRFKNHQRFRVHRRTQHHDFVTTIN